MKKTLITQTAKELQNTKKLIHRFSVKEKNKIRMVNDPIPPLKSMLRQINPILTEIYVQELIKHNLQDIAHAYLPKKSIRTNAEIHRHSYEIIKFDFAGFYDHVVWEYFVEYLIQIEPGIKHNQKLVKRLFIDPKTNGITQGLPVSGACAGLALIPFWKKLKQKLPNNIVFTQYSDDLIFSVKPDNVKPPEFDIKWLTKIIMKSLKQSNRNFKLKEEKTCIQKRQFRKITGVRINEHNEMTVPRYDEKFFRLLLHQLNIGEDINEILKRHGFASIPALRGKISYCRSIDQSGKLERLLMKYKNIVEKYNLANFKK